MMHPVAYGRTAELHGPAVQNSQQGGVDPRLKSAAHSFEASLIQELLEPMQHDPLFSDPDGDGGMGGLAGGAGDAGMDTMSSLSTETLAQAMSDHGGLGIAAEVLKEVHAAKEGEMKDKTKTGAVRSLKVGIVDTQLLPWSSARRLP